MEDYFLAPESNFFKIPPEVMNSFILPHLNRYELLRMRLVCKNLKQFLNDYIENHFEMEINETNFTFMDYIKSDLQTNRIYLNNQSSQFFKDPAIPKFIQFCSSNITHLRVARFETCYSKPEDNFFSALTSLQHLELDHTVLKLKPSNKAILKQPCYLPKSFKNLLTLKFGKFASDERLAEVYIYDFIKHCSKIEHLKVPIFEGLKTRVPKEIVINLQRQSEILKGNRPTSLKCYDLQNFDDQPATKYFSQSNLLKFCIKNNVKLLNVDVSNELLANLVSKNNDFLGLLVSVQNIHEKILVEDVPNIEKLVISSQLEDSDFHYFDIVKDDNYCLSVAPTFPKLKILDITIGSGSKKSEAIVVDVETPSRTRSLRTDRVYQFLFQEVERKGLRDLTIRFDKKTRITPTPLVRNIVSSCKNLTKLTLSNWKGSSKIGAKLWKGLPLLEQVTIDACATVSDLAFMGPSTKHSSPVFLELKNLKILTLSGMESMSQITDIAFEKVFKHLKVKEFILTSNEPIISVSVQGIQQLLEGEFITHVEKLPFDQWSLENLSEHDFMELQSVFRALMIR